MLVRISPREFIGWSHFFITVLLLLTQYVNNRSRNVNTTQPVLLGLLFLHRRGRIVLIVTFQDLA